MLKTFVLSAVAATAFAAPAKLYLQPSKDAILSVDQSLITPNCSLANVSMNLGNVSLPPPSGQKLLHVAVGRGIQVRPTIAKKSMPCHC